MIVVVVLSSCGTNFSLQKRKYTKGFYLVRSGNKSQKKEERKKEIVIDRSSSSSNADISNHNTDSVKEKTSLFNLTNTEEKTSAFRKVASKLPMFENKQFDGIAQKGESFIQLKVKNKQHRLDCKREFLFEFIRILFTWVVVFAMMVSIFMILAGVLDGDLELVLYGAGLFVLALIFLLIMVKDE